MTRLQWDKIDERNFEAGVDRGVLYGSNGYGIPWNGLISVTEAPNVSTSPVFYDGHRINDLVTYRSFSGTLRAFTYPEEFLEYEGLLEDAAGLIITEQPLKRFHISYRTKLGSGQDGIESGYRIHILYNVVAVPSARTYQTLGLEIEPLEFEWAISAIPEELAGFKPTSHLIVDSRKLPSWFLADIEDVLYGSDSTEPFLPSIQSLAAYVNNWDRIIIMDNADGTWTVATTIESVINDLGNGEFDIVGANTTTIDADTYEISSTERDEGELWQQ